MHCFVELAFGLQAAAAVMPKRFGHAAEFTGKDFKLKESPLRSGDHRLDGLVYGRLM
jgi:hypothetical protein